MAVAPDATNITVAQVVAELDTRFAAVARAVEEGEFTLWVGSGISRRAPSLGGLIARAIEFLRAGVGIPQTANAYRTALKEAIELSGHDPAVLEARFGQGFDTWPERCAIVDALWNQYSRVLDIRVPHERSDFILWNAVDIRDAFANPAPPAAQHLCIAVLILEGAVRTVASANWDGFIEAAVERLTAGVPSILQVVVDPNHMRSPPGRATLLKFHGCIVHATDDPDIFRSYLTGSHTQIVEWPDEPRFAAMRNAVITAATNQKALVLGLSIQDMNLQSVFSRAKQVNPWPWPCHPDAPAHVFCEEAITQGQRDVLRVVYGDAYNDNAPAILEGTHLRAWAEQVLIALALRVVTDKLLRLMELGLSDAGRAAMAGELSSALSALRDAVAGAATPDPDEGSRTSFTEVAIAAWSRLVHVFRTGALPAATGTYEAVSAHSPAQIGADHNAVSAGIGRLAIILALLQHGRSAGLWEVAPVNGPDPQAGSLLARSSRRGAPTKPIFAVRSATEAIALQSAGAFANDNAVVIHADDTWHRLFGTDGSGGARRVRGAPGRTGRPSVTHVSLGALLARCDSAAALKAEFTSEMVL